MCLNFEPKASPNVPRQRHRELSLRTCQAMRKSLTFAVAIHALPAFTLRISVYGFLDAFA
jgi:hypothetical protein